jgi:alpha-D-ribose 1-methylphosphonate 5-triphosphate synthase subunit PhnH
MTTALHVTSGPPPSTARLDAAASQRVFRCLLDAFAHPGRICDLTTGAVDPTVDPVLLPVLALADLEVLVHLVDEPERAAELNRLVARSTGARTDTTVETADMVVASGTIDAHLIARCRTGDAWRPEDGARLSLRCTHPGAGAATGGDAPVIRVTGPGARTGRTVRVAGVTAGVFEAIDAANAEHPAGIDTWLIDGAGRCVGLPRSCRIELVQGGR